MDARIARKFQAQSAKVRMQAANWLLERRDLPPRLNKVLALGTFLLVASLAVSGGMLVIAVFMHVVVTKLDMPPTLSYPVYSNANGSPSSVPAPANQSSQQAARVGTAPGSGRKTGTAQTGTQASAAESSIVVVPRPTLAKAMDQLISHMRDPAARYIQADAVGLGLLLQREVHTLLTRALGDATRSAPVVEKPQGVPLTQGQ